MLLKAIFFIPTILTYGIILMLILILGFLVIYICHKIYSSIYDNLPLPNTGRTSPPLLQGGSIVGRSEQFRNQASMHSIWLTNRSHISNSKAVRIIISLETCYLAYIVINVATQRCRPSDDDTCVVEALNKPVSVIKYYDHLSKIPKGKVCMRCSQRSLSAACVRKRSMIDAAINTETSDHGGRIMQT